MAVRRIRHRPCSRRGRQRRLSRPTDGADYRSGTIGQNEALFPLPAGETLSSLGAGRDFNAADNEKLLSDVDKLGPFDQFRPCVGPGVGSLLFLLNGRIAAVCHRFIRFGCAALGE